MLGFFIRNSVFAEGKQGLFKKKKAGSDKFEKCALLRVLFKNTFFSLPQAMHNTGKGLMGAATPSKRFEFPTILNTFMEAKI